MFGMLTSWKQVRAVRRLCHSMAPNIKESNQDVVALVATVLVDFQLRATKAEHEASRLRQMYEPTRNRVKLPGGGTIVQPVGIGRLQ